MLTITAETIKSMYARKTLPDNLKTYLILLENNNSGSAGFEERLDQRQERRDYKEKIKDLKKEISELTDRKHNNDEIESGVLDTDNALTE